MTNPGPPGEDERPLAGPDAGMGLPESGTQHATSTDFGLPLGETAEQDTNPLRIYGGVTPGDTPPPGRPVAPAYDDPSELVDAAPGYGEPPDLLPPAPGFDDPGGPGGLASTHAGPAAAGLSATPAYDELAEEVGLAEPVAPTTMVPAGGYRSATDSGSGYPGGADGGLLAKVKAFAGQRPEAFLGAALAAGWLVGKLFSSSDDGED